MKIVRDFSVNLLDLEGEAIRSGPTVEGLMKVIAGMWPELTEKQQVLFNTLLDKEAGKKLTLGSASVSALIGIYDNDRELSDDERIRRMELARKLHKEGLVEITTTERDLLKPLFKKRFGGVLVPVIAGELLEQEPLNVKKD